MKKFFWLALLFFFILFLNNRTNLVFAQWDDCPKGEVNDSYPGECGNYIDTNKDGICDHSQPAPQDQLANISSNTDKDNNSISDIKQSESNLVSNEDLVTGQELKQKTVAEVATIYGIDEEIFAQRLSQEYQVNIKPKDNFQLLHDNYGISPSRVKEIASEIKVEGSKNNLGVNQNNQNSQLIQNNFKTKKAKYSFFPILIPALIFYLLGWLLVKKGLISRLFFFRFWNFWLLISFLVSGLLGIMLVLRINYQIVFPFPFNMLFWHVEAGILMAIISVFHILWHWRYFVSFFQRKN